MSYTGLREWMRSHGVRYVTRVDFDDGPRWRFGLTQPADEIAVSVWDRDGRRGLDDGAAMRSLEDHLGELYPELTAGDR